MNEPALALRTRVLALRRDVRDAIRLRRADAAFVSFPKSGRTFVRVMLSRLYQQRYGIGPSEILEFDNYHRKDARIPRILFTHDGDSLRRPGEFPTDKSAYARVKVVLLARHPIDVIVSRYFHLKHRSRDSTRRTLAEQSIADFAWSDLGGLPSIVSFLNGWAEARNNLPSFGLFAYEDFRSDGAGALARLAAFLGAPSEPKEIAEAVSFASFENLQSKEREGFFRTDRIGARRQGDEQSLKVRSGKVAGYRVHFDPDQCTLMEAFVAEHLDPIFGYTGIDRPEGPTE